MYSGNIGKKNIVGSVVFEITSNKSSWERFEIYFHGTQKSKKKKKKKKKKYLKKMISYDIIDSIWVNPQ